MPVIVRLSDGLGNQLFQYAAGLAIALRGGCPISVDVSAFREGYKRAYCLGELESPPTFATRKELALFETPIIKGRRHLPLIWAEYLGLFTWPRVYKDYSGVFQPELLSAKGNCLLVGYWQSALYFSQRADDIRACLRFRRSASPFFADVLERVRSCSSVALHVRRGDYVAEPVLREKHGVLSLRYYLDAVSFVKARLSDSQFFVFTDDPCWAEEDLRARLGPISVVSGRGLTDVEELQLMSACSHHVIANSTFSWWGAWLAGQSGGLTVAPSRWFADEERNRRFQLPSGWVRI